MKTKSAVTALNTPLSAPSVPGGQHWQAQVLPNDHQRDNIDPDKPVIRWMSDKMSLFRIVMDARPTQGSTNVE